MKKQLMRASIAALAVFSVATAVSAGGQINTGGETGSYFGKFCPLVRDALKKSKFDYSCVTSRGSRENILRISGTPTDIGFSQLDVFKHENDLLGGRELFSVIRSDIARECIFMVSRNKELANFGRVSAIADRLRIILPPEKSGSAGTFEYLQALDPDGLGSAVEIEYAGSTDEAIKRALASDDAITLFVQFPDPDNARFKLIDKLGGHFIPVISRAVLRQQVGGEKVYFAQETDIANAKWHKAGKKVVTACTPMILFTGKSDRIDDAVKREDHKDLIATLRAMDQAAFVPKRGFFSRMWRKTKALSGAGVEKLIKMTDEAREKAKPYVDKAKDATDKALRKAKDATKKAYRKLKKVGKDAVEGTKEAGRKVMDKMKDVAE